MIAPYFSDIDTRGTGKIWYRSTFDPLLLAKAKNDIPLVLSGPNFNLTWLFIATWDQVGYYNQKTDKVIITAECMYMHVIYTQTLISPVALNCVVWQMHLTSAKKNINLHVGH